MLKDFAKVDQGNLSGTIGQTAASVKKWTEGVPWGRLSGWEEPSMVKRSLQGPRIPPPFYKNSRLDRTLLD